jgi:aryl-alcohol dehydrogenase-like predicted oxidoreductase
MILRNQFGRTGHASTRIIFGAYALSKATQAEADRILYMLLECGVNHIDTAPMYGNAEEASPPHPGERQTSIKKLAIDEWRRSQR